MLRRIKTWLRSRIAQARLNSSSILYDHKSILDVRLLHVANKFADHHPDRKKTFGSFTEKDL